MSAPAFRYFRAFGFTGYRREENFATLRHGLRFRLFGPYRSEPAVTNTPRKSKTCHALSSVGQRIQLLSCPPLVLPVTNLVSKTRAGNQGCYGFSLCDTTVSFYVVPRRRAKRCFGNLFNIDAHFERKTPLLRIAHVRTPSSISTWDYIERNCSDTQPKSVGASILRACI